MSNVNGVGPIRFEAVTAVTATPSVQLGTKVTDSGKDYVYVYNDCNSSILTGLGTTLQSGATGMSVTISSVTGADCLIGVAVNTITTGYYGWLLTRGVTNIEANTTSGTLAAGEALILGVNGMFNRAVGTSGATAGEGIAVIGKALEAVVSGASGSAFIRAFG